MTGILRKHLTDHFTQVPNETIRDAGLSYKAVGVLVHILSLPDGAHVSATSLADAHTDGRSAVLSALRELTEHDYYRSTLHRDDKGLVRTEITVSDRPMTGQPECGYPTPDNPTSDNPTPREEDLRQKTSSLVPNGTTDAPPADPRQRFPTAKAIRLGAQYPPEFEAIWDTYPRRIGKTAAYKAWMTRLDEGRQAGVSIERRTTAMIRASVNYAAACRSEGRDREHIKHPSTFYGPGDHWKEFVAATTPPDVASRPRTAPVPASSDT